MTSTVFVSGTTIASDWLNDVNDVVYTPSGVPLPSALANGTSNTQGSSLVGYLPASGPPSPTTTVQAKLRDVVSVKDFGAEGDGHTDDTAAIQAAIAYCESNTYYGGRALYIPGGRYVTTGSLTISKEFLTIYGDGPWESQIYAVGLATSALTTAVMNYLRPVFNNFAVVNTGTGKGIDFGNITSPPVFDGQVYLGELKNIYIESGDDGFYAPHFFSMSMINVSSLSRSGHSFRVACGPGVNWIGCYAVQCGPGKAGYRLRGSILLNACNGLNEGDFWGVFGSNPTNLDGFQNDFADNDFPDITLLNCNLERWGSLTTGGEAVRVVNTYRTFTFLGGKIDRFDLATNYSAIINCFTGSNGGTEPVRLGIGALFLGGGTPSLANLYSAGQAFYFDVNDQFYLGGITSFKQGATVYPILRQWVAGDVYGDNAHYFNAVSPRRLSVQMVRYAEPLLALTPSGAGTTIDVTGYTKVIVTASPGTTLTTATFNATPNTVSDYGRNGDLLIEATNGNLTINHSASGGNTFKLSGGVNVTMAPGQVMRFCRSDTNSNWWQV